MNRRQGLKLIATTPLLLAMSSQKSQSMVWTRAADMPLALQEIYPALFQDEVIVAGGIGSRAGVPYFPDRCVAYRPSTDTWREHSELPEPRHHGALVVADNRLFLIGGFNGGYTHIWRMRDTVHEFVDNEWQLIGTLPLPQAEGVAATSDKGLIHVVTGQSPKSDANKKRSDHKEIHQHWCWHPNDTQWRELAPIPTARNSATGGWVDSELIVAGGRTRTGNLDDVEIYNLKTDSWRKAKPLPLPQAGTASVTIDDGLIVMGGEIFQPKAAVFKEVWRYSVRQDNWHALPPLKVPRHGLGAVKLGSKAYVIGGAVRPSGSGTSTTVEVLDISAL